MQQSECWYNRLKVDTSYVFSQLLENLLSIWEDRSHLSLSFFVNCSCVTIHLWNAASKKLKKTNTSIILSFNALKEWHPSTAKVFKTWMMKVIFVPT